MLKYKNINLGFSCLTLLTTIGVCGFHSALAETAKDTGVENNISQLETPLDDMRSPVLAQGNIKSSDSNANTSELNSDREKSSNNVLGIARIVSLSFFLSFFVSFGIFYPFFIFYKRILNGDRQNSKQPVKDKQPALLAVSNPKEYSLETDIESPQATVSKLQISFSPQASNLRNKLDKIRSSVDLRTDRGVVELMRKTLSVLITQKYWTHVCCNSNSLFLPEVKPEFDLVYYSEKDKLVSKEKNFIGGDKTNAEFTSSREDFYNYIVVTLVFCTSHDRPLFKEIYTKKQLIKELEELSKMRKDKLIKFEVLWNPQNEKHYLNNEQLLSKYGDMIRLF